ncbi:hypothetical protein [Natrialbaceae archaeon AArc-T1-2]|uniref:hypothetical protein n=1 Tax=Natrialbaceae archaeon AArc-T1-2 TaxID=3053904 RepID=UPI00255B3E5E|nr:hypothetical protein [Natrialbaceae archaeon AArc-T1-2]WIV67632.1 hypothetical protein QQ977_02560 [Natrialbaceae archaeon AArc-T1-2]
MTLSRRVRRLFESRSVEGCYECRNCGREFELNRQACTRCGSFRIERSSYDDLIGSD